MPIPKRVSETIAAGFKQLRPIIEQQQARDVSEADTVTLVKDLLSEAFGYDKYTELTGEYAIRGTYCDLVAVLDDKPRVVIEVKAIGIRLDDKHVKQAVDYAANEGVEWVVLTNAVTWRLYGVVFGKPIDKWLMCEVNILDVDHRKSDQVDSLYVFTKHALEKGALADELSRTKALSRHMLAALVLHNDRVITHSGGSSSGSRASARRSKSSWGFWRPTSSSATRSTAPRRQWRRSSLTPRRARRFGRSRR